MYLWVLNHFSCVQIFEMLWTVVCQAPLSMGFSRALEWVVISYLLRWFKYLNSKILLEFTYIFIDFLSESREPDCSLLIMHSSNKTSKLKVWVQNNLVKTNRCHLCALSLASDFIKSFFQWHHSYKRNMKLFSSSPFHICGNNSLLVINITIQKVYFSKQWSGYCG